MAWRMKPVNDKSHLGQLLGSLTAASVLDAEQLEMTGIVMAHDL